MHILLLLLEGGVKFGGQLLIELFRVNRVALLGLGKLRHGLIKAVKLHLEGAVHLFQELIQNAFDHLFLALGHGSHENVKRLVHFPESRGDNFLKAVCQLIGELICHTVDGICLSLLEGDHKVFGLHLSGRHHMGMELVQKFIQSGDKGIVAAPHIISIDESQSQTIDGSQESHLDSFYQRSHGRSHRVIVCRVEILKTPDQTDEGTENTEAGKHVGDHL